MVPWLVTSRQVFWKPFKRHVMLFRLLYPAAFPRGYQGPHSEITAQQAAASAMGVLHFSLFQHNELMARLTKQDRDTSFAAFKAAGAGGPSVDGQYIAVAATLGFGNFSGGGRQSAVFAATRASLSMANCVLACSTALSYAVAIPTSVGVDCYTPFGGHLRALLEPGYLPSSNEALRNAAKVLTPHPRRYTNKTLDFWQQLPPTDFEASSFQHAGAADAASAYEEELRMARNNLAGGSLAAALAAREAQRLATRQTELQRQQAAELAAERARTAALAVELAAAKARAAQLQAAAVLADQLAQEEELVDYVEEDNMDS